jgi:hypothetical protein
MAGINVYPPVEGDYTSNTALMRIIQQPLIQAGPLLQKNCLFLRNFLDCLRKKSILYAFDVILRLKKEKIINF